MERIIIQPDYRPWIAELKMLLEVLERLQATHTLPEGGTVAGHGVVMKNAVTDAAAIDKIWVETITDYQDGRLSRMDVAKRFAAILGGEYDIQ